MSAPDLSSLVSVVVPVYNERENLAELHSRVTKAVSSTGHPFEIVLVDDGSVDGSTEMIRELSESDPRVVGVRLSRNFGHEAAIQAGMHESRGAAVIIMDADLQDSPDALADFIRCWDEGADVAYAVRTDRKESRLQRAAFSGFYRIAARMMHIDLPRDAGPFSLMSRRVVDVLCAMGEHNRYFPGLRAFAGFTQVGVPVERHARLAGETKYSFGVRTGGAINAITSFSKIPLRLVTMLGFIAAGISLLGALYVLFGSAFSDDAVPGWVSLMTVVLLISGIQLLTLGIVGEYVGKVYDEVRNRPKFIVADRWGPPRGPEA